MTLPPCVPSATRYPATMVVHTPSGPVAACDIHAGKIATLTSFLGAHCAIDLAEPGAQCANCANEANEKAHRSALEADRSL